MKNKKIVLAFVALLLIAVAAFAPSVFHVTQGGTDRSTLTAHAVLLGAGTSPINFASVVGTGNCLKDNGTGSDPTFQSCGGGTTLCETGLGDGFNVIGAATYLQTFCFNDTGATWTISGIRCFTDNSGTSTLNATDSSNTGLLTGAITCSSSFASGTQSGTTTIANGGYIKFTFVADGTSKQTTWTVKLQ